ncbi:MAG: RNA polymerase factor sigma-54 [Ignavibacteria bacterium]|nr:RNA polymerase factor sigma-54 [Ignavibacteria bacterium]
MINLSQQLRLGLRLTPQQVQYLKLLQLPTLALEQRIKMELELNPMLEMGDEIDQTLERDESEEVGESSDEASENEIDDGYTLEDYINDDIAGYKSPESIRQSDDEDQAETPIPFHPPLSERLLAQFRLQDVDETDILIAEEIIGNVDTDGYLRRPLDLIVQDLNLSYGLEITMEKAERVLELTQQLEPPGIAARTLQECLRAQVKTMNCSPITRELALKILDHYFDDLKLKRYDQLSHNLNVGLDTLRKVVDLIQGLNPKPGEGEFSAQENYVTPDFIVEKDDGDFLITLNDRHIPTLRLNKAYREMVTPKGKKASKETREFIKKKFEAAKWFIASIHQRRETLLRVMRVIVQKQSRWFDEGEILKPMIYKDVSGVVGVDISTISRVVNSKFVQTEFGVFSLKFFFTSAIESTTGEDISNLTVKNRVKEIIGAEDPKRPFNDDKIADILRKEGIVIARRTVAKYREQLGLPIARLRKSI